MLPDIYTSRLLLRHIRPTDDQRVFQALSHPDVIRYYGVSYQTYEEIYIQMNWFEQLVQEQTGGWWAICLPNHPDELIGACGFYNRNAQHHFAETGYWLLPAYQRKGYMQEALKAMTRYICTEMGVHRIEAIVELENKASTRVLEQTGFRFEGIRRECEWKNGRFISLEVWSLLASEVKSEK